MAMAGIHTTSTNSHSHSRGGSGGSDHHLVPRRWNFLWRFLLLLWCVTLNDVNGTTAAAAATSRPFGVVVGGVTSNMGTDRTRLTTTTTKTRARRRRTFKHLDQIGGDSFDRLKRMRGGSQNDHSDRGSGRQGYIYDDDYYNNNDGRSSSKADLYYRDDSDNDRGRQRPSSSSSSSRYYNDDYYGFDDMDIDGRNSGRDGSGLSRVADMMPDLIKTGNRQIGLPLLGIGTVLTVLGMSLFFNKTLMRLGNLFFVAGVPMTLGPGRTAGYFLQPRKARATACLVVGVFLVFVGWPILGLVLEIFGLLNLFGNMFPVAMAILKQMPVIGPMLKGDIGGGSGNGARRNGVGGGYRYDDYYDDDGRYRGRDDDRDGYYNDDRDDFNQAYY